MHLRKYYLDLVTNDGRAFVWHWAELRWPSRRWGLLRLTYAGELAWDRGDAVASSTVRAGAEPSWFPDGGMIVDRANDLRWCCRAFSLDGCWRRSSAGLSLELLPERPGAVRWACLQPHGEVEVVRRGERLAGTGYAERLDLGLAPWRLPIDTLRWGRVACGARSVVWIGWHGPRPLRVVVVDGVLVPDADDSIIGDGVVVWRGGRVTLDRDVLLRDERLGTSLRGPLAVLRAFLPRRAVAARETRWLSQAVLVGPTDHGSSENSAGPRLHHGLAMHERVEFGGSA